MDNARLQISGCPGAQRGRCKSQQCTKANHNSRKNRRFGPVRYNSGRDQLPHRDDKLRAIDTGEGEPDKIDAADDPEAVFELEFRRLHVCTVATARSARNAKKFVKYFRFVAE